jgi:hypothetical protein
MPRATAILLAILALATPAPAGSITYGLKSYTNLQNGYSLVGTITTDGVIGTITAADITAWTFTVSGGPNGFTESGGPLSGLSLSMSTGTYLTTASLFEIPQPTDGIANALTLAPLFNRIPLSWYRDTDGTDIYECDSPIEYNALWIASGSPLSLGGVNPWIIAAVTPEPGTLVLAVIGGGCLAVAGLARQWVRSAGSRPSTN